MLLQVDQTVVEQLGLARKVTCASTSTTLIADAASKDEIDMRIAQVRPCLKRCYITCHCEG
jgi:hypothetical protein